MNHPTPDIHTQDPEPLGTLVIKLPSYYSCLPSDTKRERLLSAGCSSTKRKALAYLSNLEQGLLWEVEWPSECDSAVGWVWFCVNEIVILASSYKRQKNLVIIYQLYT